MENKNEIVLSKVKLKGKIKKIIRALLMIIISFLIGFFTCFFGRPDDSNDVVLPHIVTDDVEIITRHIEKALENSSQLITAVHNYQAVNIYESQKEFIGIKVPFTQNKVVYVYNGVVKAGIDLSAVKFEISTDEKVITIDIPAIEIESSEVDENSFEYPYEDYSVFNKPDMSDYIELVNLLEENKKNEMISNVEFITATRENAKTVISGFISASELVEGYEIKFK